MAKLPPRIKENELETLIDNLQKGCEDAKEKLINGHLRLVYSIASKYSSRHKDFTDEIKSIAETNLTDKIEKIRTGKIRLFNYNIGAYINITTVFSIRAFLTKQTKQFETNRILIEALEKTPERIYDNVLFNLKVEEMLSSKNFTEFERTLLKHKLEGYTDSETGKILNVSQQYISKVKGTLRERLKEFI